MVYGREFSEADSGATSIATGAVQAGPETTPQELLARVQPIKVTVLLDSEDPDRRRACAWHEIAVRQLGQRPLQWSLVSLRDAMARGDHPMSILAEDETDVLIFNWDVVNGDPVYGSDLCLNLVEHYRSDLERWVERGGILILECQADAEEMIERAYRIFTSRGKYPVKLARVDVATDSGQGWSAHFNRKLLPTHPIMRALRVAEADAVEEFVLSEHEDYKEPLFPRKYVKGMQSMEERERSPAVFRGWFSERGTHPAWERILFGSHPEAGDKRPIMLFRAVRGDRTAGAIILTTMYLARSNWTDLIRGLLALPGRISAYHGRHAEIIKRRRQRIMFSALLALVVAGVVGGLAYGIAESLGAAAATVIVIAATTAIGWFPLQSFLDRRGRPR